MLLLLLDSMVSYLAINNLGISVPVNALVLLLFLFGIFKYGYPEIIWPAYVYFGIYGYFLGVTVAILSLDEFDFWRIRTVGGAAVAFAVGYASYFAAKSPKIFGRCLFLIGGLYAVVCFVALIKLLPSVFLIVESIGNR